MAIMSVATILCAGIFSPAYAATISVTPASSEIGVGEKVNVALRVDSEGVSFNAVQVTIRFPKDTLEVTGVDKTGSVLSFWLEEPQFSNDAGTITFTGGTPYGVTGSSMQVLNVAFRAKGSGVGAILFTEASVSASDGSGTNILTKMNDGVIGVIPERVSPKLPITGQETTGEKLPAPVIIVRKAVISGKLPAIPIPKISLYPEDGRWYNLVSQFTASWELPPDVSGVSTAINTQPKYTPPEKSEGLFESKTYSAQSDGTRYLHVRFQNNIGWGPTVHYKIAVDTQPPLGFELRTEDGEKTDNPTPMLALHTSDALSGLKEYQLRIGASDPIHISASDFSGQFVLPLQAPGQKNIVVRAVDQAENGIEQNMRIEILPIAPPAITFVPTEIFSEDERGLVVRGTALPDVNVLLRVQQLLPQGEKGEIVAEGTTVADNTGNWGFSFSNLPLRNGQYVVIAQNQDARGALSAPVLSAQIKVKSKPIIQVGAFQLDSTQAATLLLFLLIGGFGGGVWFNKKRNARLLLRVGFAGGETTKIFSLITKDVDNLSDALQTPTTGDDAYALTKLREHMKKMEEYLKRGIEKIKR